MNHLPKTPVDPHFRELLERSELKTTHFIVEFDLDCNSQGYFTVINKITRLLLKGTDYAYKNFTMNGKNK